MPHHQQWRQLTVSSSSPGPSGGTGGQLGVGQLQAMVQGVEDQVELGVGDDQRCWRATHRAAPGTGNQASLLGWEPA
jgi:hypothetical protein